MYRVETVPVSEPRKPHRIKYGGLANDRTGFIPFDFELQPGPALKPHLGEKPQQPVGFECLDAPEIDGIAGS
jgi:hypothetical protein